MGKSLKEGQWDLIELEGVAAYRRGESQDSCRYVDDEQVKLWLNGWYYGMHESNLKENA